MYTSLVLYSTIFALSMERTWLTFHCWLYNICIVVYVTNKTWNLNLKWYICNIFSEGRVSPSPKWLKIINIYITFTFSHLQMLLSKATYKWITLTTKLTKRWTPRWSFPLMKLWLWACGIEMICCQNFFFLIIFHWLITINIHHAR